MRRWLVSYTTMLMKKCKASASNCLLYCDNLQVRVYLRPTDKILVCRNKKSICSFYRFSYISVPGRRVQRQMAVYKSERKRLLLTISECSKIHCVNRIKRDLVIFSDVPTKNVESYKVKIDPVLFGIQHIAYLEKKNHRGKKPLITNNHQFPSVRSLYF